MVNEKLAFVGHALIWLALIIGIIAMKTQNHTVDVLEDIIYLMGILIGLGGAIALASYYEPKPKQKVYTLGPDKD